MLSALGSPPFKGPLPPSVCLCAGSGGKSVVCGRLVPAERLPPRDAPSAQLYTLWRGLSEYDVSSYILRGGSHAKLVCHQQKNINSKTKDDKLKRPRAHLSSLTLIIFSAVEAHWKGMKGSRHICTAPKVSHNVDVR